ncbi:hypothetical protein [Halolamina sp.]|uniref:hypothetical protein n=1 Tax=Halolamina sp. TaxID=1940283 RepID=UPI0015A6EA43
MALFSQTPSDSFTSPNCVEAAHEEWGSSTAEERCRYLTYHDLRRTWATALADAEGDPLLRARLERLGRVRDVP